MALRHKLSLVLLLILFVALFRWLNGPDQVGQVYPSLDALKEAQKRAGYVPIGFFGNSWPATVIDVLEENDSISFTRKNGTPHTYSGFTGHRLKVMRLLGPTEEVIVVFRSEPNTIEPEQGPVRRL